MPQQTAWQPVLPAQEGSPAKAIPMFGISDRIRLNHAIEMGKYGDAPSFSIPMLRSLAKIEIVDMVPGQSANIGKCVLTSYNTSGRFIPDVAKNKNWNDSGIQIENPSIPEVLTSSQNLVFVKTEKMVRPEGTTADEPKDCFTVYIPEMDFTLDASSRPVVNVYGTGEDNLLGTIQLSSYDESFQPKDPYDYILRNHIYRFNVMNVGSTELDFLVQTPWQQAEAGEWVYEDLKIEFEPDQEFKWKFNTDPETNLPKWKSGQLDERMIIISQDDWIEGEFKFISPSQAKWTISLYGDDNTLDDHFKVETGKRVEHTDMEGGTFYTEEWTPGGPSVSGNVGEDVLFRIVPTAVNNSDVHYVARVVLTCTTFDDRLIEVNLPYFVKETFKVSGNTMTMPTLDNNGYYYVKQYYSGFKDVDDNEPERPGGMDGENPGSTDEP